MTLLKACPVESLPEGEAIRLDTQPPIAVFHSDGHYYATTDTCTHAQFSLAEGYIDGTVVECPLHLARFCLRTGAALAFPAVQPLRTYPVVVADGYVFVDDAVDVAAEIAGSSAAG